MGATTGERTVSVSFPALLAVLFIGLKLGHVITWPWLWVLSPIWIPLAVAAILTILVVCLGSRRR